jgi:hypothetical protein
MEVVSMNPQQQTADDWERDWGAYVDALAAMDRARPDRFKRGKRRQWSKSKTAARKARARIRKADAAFSDRLGI